LRIIWGGGRAYPSTGTADTFDTVTIPLVPPRTYRVSNQAIFETPGRYTWIVPEGVFSISVMAVGGGGGGAGQAGNAGSQGGSGGGYAYMYDYPVTPGTGYTIQVGAGGRTAEKYNSSYWDVEDNGTSFDKSGDSSNTGGIASWFNNRFTCRGGGGADGKQGNAASTIYYRDLLWGGYWTVGAGLSGGGLAGGLSLDVLSDINGPGVLGGGGGAGTSSTEGGFDTTGAGGNGGTSPSGGSTGGGGGGGGGYNLKTPVQTRGGGGGGGIGIYGITATAPGSGAGGSSASNGVNSTGGGGGSGGQPGTAGENITMGGTSALAGKGGKYGGGGGAGGSTESGSDGGGGGHGVVRIIWGAGRAYPSTNTGDTYNTVTF
jgi:hypothetical protein